MRTPRLELAPPRDDDLAGLLEVIGRGVHDPAVMPFGVAWTDTPSPQREWNALKWWWRQRVELSPDQWSLGFAVFVDGAPVGMQDVRGNEFPKLAQVGTGSWLGGAFQGQGLGKEMRSAILTFAFEGLGAEVATSESFVDNPQSAGVSRAMGYEENGVARFAPRGEPVDAIRWRLTRERFEELRSAGHYARWEPVEIEGLEPCLPLLGLA